MADGHVMVARMFAVAQQGGGFRLAHVEPSGTVGVWVIRVYGPPGSQYVLDSEYVPTLEGYKHLNQPFTATITSHADHRAEGESAPPSGGVPVRAVVIGVGVLLVVVIAIVVAVVAMK